MGRLPATSYGGVAEPTPATSCNVSAVPARSRWLERSDVKTLFIAKGSPWENGYVESAGGKLRDELLNRELFLSLDEARWVIDRWRLDYNHHRPHSSLEHQTPARVFLQRYHPSGNFLIIEKLDLSSRQTGFILMARRFVLTILCLLAVMFTTTVVMAADGNGSAGSYRGAADLTPMLVYLLLALGISFLCSILEAVLLSVGPGHVQVMIDSGLRSGLIMKKLREDLDRSLSAILTLNTIAHTVGAAGVGAEVADKFGDSYLGIASALLTLLVLVLSEVIPKTLGARHCRSLAGKSAILIRWISILLFPIVMALQWFSTLLFGEAEPGSFSRRELIAITGLAEKQGHLEDDESEMVQNLLKLKQITVSEIMTPTTVLVSLAEESTVAEAIEHRMPISHSRIPLTRESHTIRTYLLYSDLLETQLAGDGDKLLATISMPIRTIDETFPVYDAMLILMDNRDKILLVVNEFGEELGIVTDEDMLEAIAGREIIDEEDEHANLREKAARQWKKSQAEDAGREPDA